MDFFDQFKGAPRRSSSPRGASRSAPPTPEPSGTAIAPDVWRIESPIGGTIGTFEVPAPAPAAEPVVDPVAFAAGMERCRLRYRHDAASKCGPPGSVPYQQAADAFDRRHPAEPIPDAPAIDAAPVASSFAPAQLPRQTANAARVRADRSCGCEPYSDVKTPAKWHRDGMRVADSEWGKPTLLRVVVEKTDRSGRVVGRGSRNVRVYCRCQVEPSGDRRDGGQLVAVPDRQPVAPGGDGIALALPALASFLP